MTARDRILKRRARLVAAALASAAGISTAAGCGPCLSIVDPDEDAAMDGALKDGMMDTQPQVCLTAPFDSGVDTGADSPADAPADAPSDGSNEAG